MGLFKKITRNIWNNCQNALVQSVIAGGTTAMQYYRRPLKCLDETETASVTKNPSTIADLHATLAIIHSLDDYLSPITAQIGSDYYCLAEETHYVKYFKNKLPESVFRKIQSPEQFFSNDSSIRVIIDGIDGTGNFLRGIPIFCSAVALFINEQLCISALYDPVHHVVYSACLPVNSFESEAWEWHISSNHRIDLVASQTKDNTLPLAQEAIGIHLTRNNPDKVNELLKQSHHSNSILEDLSRASAGIYAFNSGHMAMINIARGALGAYVNNTTHLWDIAAGEVLVRACGGNVTGFDKNSISYDANDRVSVIAARQHIYETLMRIIRKE